MKQQVSHRLDSELLAWATEYGGSRGSSRAVVIEEALRHFRALSRGGVPDLPVGVDLGEDVEAMRVGKPKPKPQGRRMETSADWALARQAKLNEAKSRASR